MDMIGERVRQLRKESGLNQSQLAEYLGVDQSMIAKIESDDRKLNTEQIDKLCILFGCDFEYLVGENDESTPLVFSYRAKNADVDTLKAVAMVSKIAVNLRMLNRMLEEHDER